jgi:two-component system chemotaxis response regulator CheY
MPQYFIKDKITMSSLLTRPVKALIVDDSPTLRGVLAAILSSGGIEVIGQLASGQGLLQTIAQMSPDIVCLDYNLPGSNGIELLKSITSEHPHVAVVMITGEATPGLQHAAAEAGSAGFIRKPFSQEQIAKEFRLIIQTQRFLIDVKKSSGPSNVSVTGHAVTSKAIVVDDSKTIRALLLAILSQDGIQVVGEATNGLQAVTMVQELQPDIVFLDVVMPIMGGMEALKQIRKVSTLTKIVMITANSSRDLVIEAVKEGAAGFIVKPLVAEKVSEAIAKVLRS